MTEIRDRLNAVFSEDTCVVGLGNTFRNDDAIGVLIAERLLADQAPQGITVINAEDVIESYAFQIAESKGKNVLLIDAVQATGAQPGSLVFGKLDELEAAETDFSTHKLALSTAAKIFTHFGKTTYLLGVVAADVDYGNRLSSGMLESAETVVEWIRRARS